MTGEADQLSHNTHTQTERMVVDVVVCCGVFAEWMQGKRTAVTAHLLLHQSA